MPDITVCRCSDRPRDGRQAKPLLVVEALSPSTRRNDLGRKRNIYEAAGVPSYWVIDADQQKVTVLERENRVYTGRLVTSEAFTVAKPLPVTVSAFG